MTERFRLAMFESLFNNFPHFFHPDPKVRMQAVSELELLLKLEGERSKSEKEKSQQVVFGLKLPNSQQTSPIEELGEPTIFMQGTLLPDGNGDIQFGAVRVTTQRHEIFPKE